MTLTGSIESAEHQYKKILEEFFISEYGDRNISSHGLGHHRRVWGYAKKLISILNESGYIDDNCIPFKLIIACYLHDIGMSIDPGVNHGFHSKVLCNRFLVKNNLPENDYRDVLQAVHNHDNKEYKDSLTSFDLLTILSVADDLDAFGFTGIYRYSEIYLIRGISHRDIGKLILANATGRFENFKRHFGFSKVLLEEQEKKFPANKKRRMNIRFMAAIFYILLNIIVRLKIA